MQKIQFLFVYLKYNKSSQTINVYVHHNKFLESGKIWIVASQNSDSKI